MPPETLRAVRFAILYTEAMDGELQRALERALLAKAILPGAPHSQLLELIISTAAHVLRATHGSLFLLDEETRELVFEVALGEPIHEFKKLRLPLGHGIAGLVAVTGQAMAIADVADDPRHASEIAQQTGYSPQALVCVPLVYAERIIGVIELMDKLDGTVFTPADIDTLERFANQAAITIDQSRTRQQVVAMLLETFPSLAENHGLLEQLHEMQRQLEQDPRHRQAVGMARDIQAICESGEAEVRVCQMLLRDLADYIRSRP
jgi:GAF domain-containing protein